MRFVKREEGEEEGGRRERKREGVEVYIRLEVIAFNNGGPDVV